MIIATTKTRRTTSLWISLSHWHCTTVMPNALPPPQSSATWLKSKVRSHQCTDTFIQLHTHVVYHAFCDINNHQNELQSNAGAKQGTLSKQVVTQLPIGVNHLWASNFTINSCDTLKLQIVLKIMHTLKKLHHSASEDCAVVSHSLLCLQFKVCMLLQCILI